PAAPEEGRSRFAAGLAVALLVFLILLAVYALREPIAARLPRAAPYLEAYAARVDALRHALHDLREGVTAALAGTAPGGE
ncbi:MAG: hypothetical protein D6686_10890, partial [Alphaproteobacteria bacterium]